MNQFLKDSIGTIKIVILALILTAGINLFAANWTIPPQSPPGGNTAAPLNTTNVAQEKVGGLTLASGSGITTGFVVKNGNVGFGVTAPTAKLDINGQIRIRGGSPGANKVLTSSADGTATWVNPGASGGITTWRSPALALAYNEHPTGAGSSYSNPVMSNLGSSGEYAYCAIGRITHDGKNGAACIVEKSGNQWQMKIWKDPAGDGGITCNATCFKFN